LVKYTKADDRKAWTAIAVTVLMQIIAFALIKMNFIIIGWSFNVFICVRIFVQFHDMAHFSFFSSITMNRFVGKIFGIYTHFPFNAWRDGHNHHHKHFGNIDRLDLSQTILFTKKQYESWSGLKKIAIRILREPIIFFTFSVPYVWFIGTLFTNMKRYGIFSTTVL
jgi:omega-6 fatty acid desaturase (delta-12 desaturase)